MCGKVIIDTSLRDKPIERAYLMTGLNQSIRITAAVYCTFPACAFDDGNLAVSGFIFDDVQGVTNLCQHHIVQATMICGVDGIRPLEFTQKRKYNYAKL